VILWINIKCILILLWNSENISWIYKFLIFLACAGKIYDLFDLSYIKYFFKLVGMMGKQFLVFIIRK